jgi:hypothetical protein
MPKGEKKARYPELAERARQMIETELATQRHTAQVLGLHPSTIERWATRFGWRSQRTGPRSGCQHPGWKGGRALVGRYWYVYRPDHPHATKHGRVAEHRLVYEAKIGRYLLPSEVCHHIDGNPSNNDPTNLQHFQTNGHHLAHELKGRCPQWSPEGRQRIDAGILAKATIRRQSRLCGHRYIRTTDHPTS